MTQESKIVSRGTLHTPATPFGAYALDRWRARLLARAQAMPVSWWGRRGALLLRKLVLRGGPSIVDAEVEGLKLRLHTGDNVSERKFLFMPQFFDHAERTLMRARLTEGSVFIDIGANAGIYTMTAAQCVGARGRVLAVEPNPVVLERLLFNAQLNGFENRITPLQIGVSDVPGAFDLVLDRSNLGGSSLVVARSAESIRVQCLPLGDILAQHSVARLDGMKIDIEGAEDRVLIPFLREAPVHLHPTFIVLENSPSDWQADLPAALKSAGYRLSVTTRMNMIWEKT